MGNFHKSQANILEKFQIQQLNPMQLEAQKAIQVHNEIMILSSTETGKTQAFQLPLIKQLDTT